MLQHAATSFNTFCRLEGLINPTGSKNVVATEPHDVVATEPSFSPISFVMIGAAGPCGSLGGASRSVGGVATECRNEKDQQPHEQGHRSSGGREEFFFVVPKGSLDHHS